MKRAIVFLLLCSTGFVHPAFPQCPVTDFSSATSACRNQTLPMLNLSAAGSYTWDFCSGDFNLTPTGELVSTLAGVNGRPGIEFAFDNKWFAFVTGTFGNLLYRLEFDNGLQSAPTNVVNLGSLGGKLNQPGQLRLMLEGTQWYGILHNTSGELLKLAFGTQLSNVPTVSTLLTGLGNANAGLAVGKDPVEGYVAVISNASNDFSMIRLGNLLGVPNPVSDVINSAAVPNPNNLGDLDIINVCGNWYGIADNLGNGNIYRMDFGASLFSIPTITQIQSVAVSNPGRLRLAKEGEDYYFLMMTLDGVFIKGAFGSSITSIPAMVNEGNLGGVLPPSMYGLAMVKENSEWAILGVSLANGQLYRARYTDNCSVLPKTSSLANPTVVYAQGGTYAISLDTKIASGQGTKVRMVTVAASDAPDIIFSTQNNCLAAPVQFTSSNVSGSIISYAWDFGDGQVSAAPNPSHTYAWAGPYEPLLTVTASNGCTNFAKQSLEVFLAPVAEFDLPAVTPVCTFQGYTLANTSLFDPVSSPVWEWRVNGSVLSTQEDLYTIFSVPTAQEIRLKVSIPGCENERLKIIPAVVAGPWVDFSAADDCALNSVSFSNTTTGADAGYSWDFGDGSPPSTLAQPVHTYTTEGNYTVTLSANNLAGCNNFTTQNITIFSVPQPDFSVGAPPFSCSNSPTLFQNQTPQLTDSNISDWQWNFGDPASSTSAANEPMFVYTVGGTYTVTLTATSDAGCSNTIIKPVAIGDSPVANFVLGPACVNTATQFSDISSGGVQSRVWQISTSTFTSPNPTYTFTSPGNYMATLTITGMSGCTNMVSKPVNVPVPPTLTLQVENPCVGQPTQFTLVDAILPPLGDIVNTWQWNIGGTLISGNPATTVVTLAGATPVSVITTHASGCSYMQSNTTAINPSPVADFIATPDRGDAPLTVQFQNLSSGASQYQWLFSGKIPTTSTTESPVYTFLELGDYTAQLTATNTFGCADVKSIPIQVLVPEIDLEVISFSLLPDATTGKLRPSLTIRNSSNIPVMSVEVSLLLSDKANVSETMTVNLSPGSSSMITLTTLVEPGQFANPFVCVEVLSERDISPANNKSCINFAEADYVFDPYPNPSAGQIQLDWVSGEAGVASVTIYNVQGRKEYYWETPSQPGLNQSVHDLSFLSAGVYFVAVQTSSTLQTRRIVRQ